MAVTYSVNAEPEAEQLGRLERTFVFDTRRVVTNAVWGVVIGAVFTLISIVVIEHELSANVSTQGPNYFVGLLIALALLLPLSLARLVQAVVRRNECYWSMREVLSAIRPRATTACTGPRSPESACSVELAVGGMPCHWTSAVKSPAPTGEGTA
jgi:hypothetical protein